MAIRMDEEEIGKDEISALVGRWVKPMIVADLLQVSDKTVLALVHSGELEGTYFGKSIRVNLSSLLEYMKTHKITKNAS